MVIFTPAPIDIALIDIESARLDRYRPVLSLSPEPCGRLVAVEVRPISPMFAMVTGEVRPVAGETNVFIECEKSPMSWHQGTEHNTTVFGGGFASFVDDIRTRVGPPPPRRPSV